MGASFGTFLEKLMLMGLEYFNKYYGSYRGIVTRNDDPEERYRIQARVPTVGHDQAPDIWIDPKGHSGVQHGAFFPPVVGSAVWVEFARGDAGSPVAYTGGWWGEDDTPAELAYVDGRPEKRGIITRAGHALIFSDEADNEYVRLLWHKPEEGDEALTDPTKAADRTAGSNSFLSFESDGSIQIANKNGSLITLNADNENIFIVDQHANSITLDSDGIKLIDKAGNVLSLVGGEAVLSLSKTVHIVAPTVNLKGGSVFLGDGASISAVLGEQLLAWLAAHTHPTGAGPSGPPVPIPTPSLLSKSVKLKA
jgi:hypothetical protein